MATSHKNLLLHYLAITAVNTFLGGIAISQCTNYFLLYRNDPKILRWVVAVVAIIGLFQNARDSADLWLLKVQYPASPGSTQWISSIQNLCNGAMASIVQVFYAYRIRRLGRHNSWICIPVLVLSAGQFCMSVARTVEHFLNSQTIYNTSDLYCAALALAVACDALITCTMVGLLLRERGRTSSEFMAFEITRSRIDRLIRLLVVTNAAPLVASILALAFSSGINFGIPSTLLVLLYEMSFLAILNSRPVSRVTLKSSLSRPNLDSSGKSSLSEAADSEIYV